jgi:hypothetical protein
MLFQGACVHGRFFAFASSRAMVAAVIRTPFDRFGKQMVRDAVEGLCSVESDAEVPASTRRIDLWVTPLEARASPLDHLGLLGRIISNSVTLEFFHNTISGDELHVCLLCRVRHNKHYADRRIMPIALALSVGGKVLPRGIIRGSPGRRAASPSA